MSDEVDQEESDAGHRTDKRIKKLTATNRQSLARIKELEDALATQAAERKTYEVLAQSLEEKEAQLSHQRVEHEAERAIMARGITDEEGIQIARFMHSKLGEDAPPIGDWLSGDGLPKAVSAYLPVAAPPDAPAPPADAPAPVGNPVAANNGAQAQPAYSGKADLKAAATNLDYYRANRDQLLTPDGFLKSS